MSMTKVLLMKLKKSNLIKKPKNFPDKMNRIARIVVHYRLVTLKKFVCSNAVMVASLVLMKLRK